MSPSNLLGVLAAAFEARKMNDVDRIKCELRTHRRDYVVAVARILLDSFP